MPVETRTPAFFIDSRIEVRVKPDFGRLISDFLSEYGTTQQHNLLGKYFAAVSDSDSRDYAVLRMEFDDAVDLGEMILSKYPENPALRSLAHQLDNLGKSHSDEDEDEDESETEESQSPDEPAVA